MKLFKLELHRAIINKWMAFALMVTFIMCLIPVWNKYTYMRGFYEVANSGVDKVICTATPYENWLLYDQIDSMHYVYLFIIPILVALPFGASYYIDLKTGYIKQLVSRCGMKKYLLAKYTATFISGGIVAALPLLLQLMLLGLIFPVNKPQRFGSMFFCETAPGIDLYYEHPFAYCIIWCIIIFVVGGLLATISLTVTNIAYNYFSIILTPFMFTFMLIFFVYITGKNEVSFLYSICAVTSNSYNYWIPIGEVIGVLFATSIPFLLGKKEVL